MNAYQAFLCGFVLLGWMPLAHGAEPQFPTPRPYAGEASYEEMKKILPRVGGQWTVLSPENARTKFMLTWNGAVRTYVYATYNGVDTGHADLAAYKPDTMMVRFGAGDPPRFEETDNDQMDQRLIHGYLPGAETCWRHDDVEYSQVAFATLFEAERVVTGYENTIALVRMSMKNLGENPKDASLWVKLGTAKALRWQDNFIYDESDRIRMFLEPDKDARLTFFSRSESPTGKDSLRFVKRLAPQEQVDLYLTIPCLPTNREKESLVRSFHFQSNLEKFVAHWEQQLERGMKVEVPEEVVNEIYKSQLGRFFTSAQRDPHANRWFYKTFPYTQGVGSHVAPTMTALDQRGYYGQTAQYIEDSYLAWQGNMRPEGEFTSQEGWLSGPEDMETSPHAYRSAYVLLAVFEHYKLSRDREWLERVIPNILAGCDWVKRERAATKKLDENGEKLVYYGCLPPHMIEEWTWRGCGVYADALYHRVLLDASEVLADVGHPQAGELAEEAADYRKCIRLAVKKGTTRADKITLANGDIIPYVPHDLLPIGPSYDKRVRPNPGDIIPYGTLADRCRPPYPPKDTEHPEEYYGWGPWSEAAQNGCLWLIFGKVFDPNEDEMTWALRFLEEYPVRVLYPGMPEYSTLIVNSTNFACPTRFHPEAIAYFAHDEIHKYVEGFYAEMAHLSWKTYMGRDHRYPCGSWYGPSADAWPAMKLRRMLIQEDGDNILLAWAVPRAWLQDGKEISVKDAPTYFGPMAYEIRSRAAEGAIEATIAPPRRNPPPEMKIKLRFRHPQDSPIQSVTVNGKQWPGYTKDTIIIPSNGTQRIEVVGRY